MSEPDQEQEQNVDIEEAGHAEGDPVVPEKSPEELEEEQRQREEEQRAREEEEKAKEEERIRLEEEAKAKREEDSRKLDEALKASGSSNTLASTADNISMTYTRLTLAEKELEALFPSILRFKEIQHLDLSTNSLTDVSILTEFSNLITLNLSKNQIVNVYCFAINERLVRLQVLNLEENKIGELTHISLPSLNRLILNQNEISSVGNWEGHPQLELLELRKNKLRKLKGLKNIPKLKELYIDENELTDIRGLENLQSLSLLSLATNKITKIFNPFPYLPLLKDLNLKENQISSLTELSKIDDHVTSINLSENPISNELGDNFKKEVIWAFGHFVKINESDVTEEERVEFEKERLEKLAQEEKERIEREEEARKAAEEQEEQERLQREEEKGKEEAEAQE